MNLEDLEVQEFIKYCHEIAIKLNYLFFAKEDGIWPEKRILLYRNGVIPGLYYEKDDRLFQLLEKQCDHKELGDILNRYRLEHLNSSISEYVRKKGVNPSMPLVQEPLEQWIYNNNYLLAYPIVDNNMTKGGDVFINEPEKILTFVFLNLKYQYYEQDMNIDVFSLENTNAIYDKYFEKGSAYKDWGLIPVDTERMLYSNDDPPRIYDNVFDKTIFLKIKRPLAMVLNDLIKQKYITQIAFRPDDFYVYDGKNHRSILAEAVETGRIFSMDIDSLPILSKLYSKKYEDSLWVIHNGCNLTFEELCEDIRIEGDAVVTQMIHMQINGNNITHLDHEYIFYDVDEYIKRMRDYSVKGNARKRIKTFKIDQSRIPLDYLCDMLKIDNQRPEKIKVPFIYFVLNAYFKHKDLLDEYFSG